VHAPLTDDAKAKILSARESYYEPIEAGPAVDANGVAAPKKGRLARRLSKFYFEQRVTPPTDEEIAEGQHHAADDLATVRPAGQITSGH
ncbi:MAG TPA: ubiquinol-cytochrome c reductase cytochrome b subunit, partial [Actinobacteria bacterium]|nr:ubiquinol-cytochrome c reductase cytochrome b subunit [Actinomycetota bacterium]